MCLVQLKYNSILVLIFFISAFHMAECKLVAATIKPHPNLTYYTSLLNSLISKKWSEDEIPCYKKVMKYLENAANSSLWAVWQLDAMSSSPSGLLYGSQLQLGHYDQCLETPWDEGYPELRPQYCVATITLGKAYHAQNKTVHIDPYSSAADFILSSAPHQRPYNKLIWGTCVPAVCKPHSVVRIVEALLTETHIESLGLVPNITVDENCQMAGHVKAYDAPFYAFVILFGTLSLISITCTFLNGRNKTSKGMTSTLIRSFCMKENAKDLLKMKKEGIEVFYGIRFFSMCFIVLDHQVLFANILPVFNGRKIDRDLFSFMGLIVLHNDLFVDSFFLLSGFLTAKLLVTYKVMPNPLILILKRYVRLVITGAVVVFFMAAVFPYIGNGPLWSMGVEAEAQSCRKNWWLNLLMLNNYFNFSDTCFLVTWYIPCDFHAFVVTVFLYWMYTKSRILGTITAGIIALASVIVPGMINYMYRLPASQNFSFEAVANLRLNDQFNLTYIKSHTRIAAYLIGFGCGALFKSYQVTGHMARLSKKWSITGALVGISLFGAMMLSGPLFQNRKAPLLLETMYAAVNRPLTAFGLALIVLSCAFGHVPLIKSFLSWYPWVPCSRLAYGVYLVHSVFIYRNIYVTRIAQPIDYFIGFTQAAGTIILSGFVALLIWLVADAPANNLVYAMLKVKMSDKPTINKTEDTTNFGKTRLGFGAHGKLENLII